MSIAVRSQSGVWGSRTTFVLALGACAIGLGNLWRFSYLVAENGGAAFVLVYLGCLFLVAVPVFIAEVVIGSHGRADPVSAVLRACKRSQITQAWVLLAWLAGFTAILVLSYQVVIASWGLAYIPKLLSGVFADASAADVAREFNSLLADSRQMVQWQSAFIATVCAISALGIHRGLGVLFWLAVPLFLVALGVLIDYNLQHGDMVRTREFLFSINRYDFTPRAVLIAMGQAFYTLGIGMGVGIAFGAYAPDKQPIGRTIIAVALFDTLVALAAGLAIFPIVFASNMEPSMGPGLMFIGLPYAFGNMVQGELFGSLFFVLVSMVALASAVALAEPGVSYLVQRMRLRRPLAVLCIGAAVWVLALNSALSFNASREVYWWAEYTFFEALDVLTAQILMPAVCLGTTLLVGYGLRREILRVELHREGKYFFLLWRACLRYIAPPVIVLLCLATQIEMT
jgi:NSS family neurotransmitter:Na+ symporter